MPHIISTSWPGEFFGGVSMEKIKSSRISHYFGHTLVLYLWTTSSVYMSIFFA